MNCFCGQKAVYAAPALCSEHLVEHVIAEVKKTITQHHLIKKGERVLVAASGGKDSITLLDILHHLGYKVHALAVDEGIKGYRPPTLVFLQKFCDERSIPLTIVSFQEEFGKPLDQMVQKQHPCSVCGVFRRYLLNKYAKEYDCIATGHNLDDEAQAVLMNLIKDNKDLLFRSFIRTPDKKGFTPRVKPLMFVPEKMITAYTFIKGFGLSYDECPYVPQALRGKVAVTLNKYESQHPGMKRKLVDAGVRIAGHQNASSATLSVCKKCGEPSVAETCRACILKEELV